MVVVYYISIVKEKKKSRDRRAKNGEGQRWFVLPSIIHSLSQEVTPSGKREKEKRREKGKNKIKERKKRRGRTDWLIRGREETMDRWRTVLPCRTCPDMSNAGGPYRPFLSLTSPPSLSLPTLVLYGIPYTYIGIFRTTWSRILWIYIAVGNKK